MTKDTTKQAQPKATAKTRTVLTPAERIAKLKAEAEALEKREADRAKGKIAAAESDLAKLKQRQADLDTKIEAQEGVVADLKKAAGITEDEAPATS